MSRGAGRAEVGGADLRESLRRGGGAGRRRVSSQLGAGLRAPPAQLFRSLAGGRAGGGPARCAHRRLRLPADGRGRLKWTHAPYRAAAVRAGDERRKRRPSSAGRRVSEWPADGSLAVTAQRRHTGRLEFRRRSCRKADTDRSRNRYRHCAAAKRPCNDGTRYLGGILRSCSYSRFNFVHISISLFLLHWCRQCAVSEGSIDGFSFLDEVDCSTSGAVPIHFFFALLSHGQ